MCTSILYSGADHYFGRNLDYEIDYGEKAVITPRNYEFNFRNLPTQKSHYAIIGISVVQDDYPLYCDAINEKGLGIAGLNFVGPGYYFPVTEGKKNIASYEFINYILGNYTTVDEVKEAVKDINITNQSFSKDLPASLLHWSVADKSGKCIVIESTKKGLNVYDNPVNVLTNNPEFPEQLLKLSDYQDVTPGEPTNTLVPSVKLNNYSRSLGTHRLPGGMDSSGRFVKVAFVLAHSPKSTNELEGVTNYFHVMESISQPKGSDQVGPDSYEFTMYTDCMNLEKGILYYNVYDNNRISALDMHKADLDASDLITVDLDHKLDINYKN